MPGHARMASTALGAEAIRRRARSLAATAILATPALRWLPFVLALSSVVGLALVLWWTA